MDRIELLQSAATDSLTEALTRRAFKQEAEQFISLALRHQHSLSCVVFDIDHFKRVNDTYGHAAGDEVLKTVASTCRAALRAGDLFGRLGGEEFAIILPHIRPGRCSCSGGKTGDCDLVAGNPRRLRHAQARQPAWKFGTLDAFSKDIETLLAQADAAMYQAKHKGRNRCVSWSSIQTDQRWATVVGY